MNSANNEYTCDRHWPFIAWPPILLPARNETTISSRTAPELLRNMEIRAQLKTLYAHIYVTIVNFIARPELLLIT